MHLSRPLAVIVVLGDLGRSPRMLNHARDLLDAGWRVALAGETENALPPDLAGRAEATVWRLRAGTFGRLISLGGLVLRLAMTPGWRLAMVQNPPGFPALLAAWLGRRGRPVRLVLDWHNTGASLLALRHGNASWRVRAYAWCERTVARLADEHLAVSAALASAVCAGGTVRYDAPARWFREAAGTGGESRAAWWMRVLPDEPVPEADSAWVVSPSSWGVDEDQAAMLRVAATWEGPMLTFIATGRGAGRAEFVQAARDLPDRVQVRVVWVPPGEYPRLLALADAGLCLHGSSSGLDLPMKLADFRGAGLPALVRDYGPVLTEVFEVGRDGWFFRDEVELGAALQRVARRDAEWKRMRDGLATEVAR